MSAATTAPPAAYDSRLDNYEHIIEVQRNMILVISQLMERMVEHDQSKLVPPERELFDVYTGRLRTLDYGTPEYEASLRMLGPALAHHYACNSHHPEYGYREERWLAVDGYTGLYEISDFGRVRSITRQVQRQGNQGSLTVHGQMLSLQPTPKGYYRVSLSRDGRPRNYMVHRLVAAAFHANPADKPEVNHKDGDKTNNYYKNLEWVTESQNLLHAYENGLREGSAKYFVHCVELDIVTLGVAKMETALRERGYPKASAAGVYNAMDREGKHLDLTFIGYPIEEGSPQCMMRRMTLVDLIELLCDWKAATMRHSTGNIRESIEKNQRRFGYSDALKQIFLNTVACDLERDHRIHP